MNKFRVLLVEDNNLDYEAFVRAFDKCGFACRLHRCLTGDETLEYLLKQGNDLPQLILLDLNLPGMDGRDVLKIIKEDQKLKIIPVVILTTSNKPSDIETCYNHGANSYLQKPVDFQRLLRIVSVLKDYWCDISVLPDLSRNRTGAHGP